MTDRDRIISELRAAGWRSPEEQRAAEGALLEMVTQHRPWSCFEGCYCGWRRNAKITTLFFEQWQNHIRALSHDAQAALNRHDAEREKELLDDMEDYLRGAGLEIKVRGFGTTDAIEAVIAGLRALASHGKDTNAQAG